MGAAPGAPPAGGRLSDAAAAEPVETEDAAPEVASASAETPAAATAEPPAAATAETPAPESAELFDHDEAAPPLSEDDPRIRSALSDPDLVLAGEEARRAAFATNDPKALAARLKRERTVTGMMLTLDPEWRRVAPLVFDALDPQQLKLLGALFALHWRKGYQLGHTDALRGRHYQLEAVPPPRGSNEEN